MSFSRSGISRVDIIDIESLEKDDLKIAVIGLTGSGKSRFIQKAWGFDSDLGVGHGHDPFTREVIAYRFTFDASSKRESVVLFDTPGLDPTKRCGSDGLHDLCKSFGKLIPLTGILYMHSLSNPPVCGLASDYMKHFKHLCGEKGLDRAFVVTTMSNNEQDESNRVDSAVALTEDYWNVMLACGSSIHTFTNTQESAWAILDSLVDLWNRSDTPWNTHHQRSTSSRAKALVPSSKQAYHFDRSACFSALLEVINSESRRKKLCQIRGGDAQLLIDYLHLELSQSCHLDYYYDQLFSLFCEFTVSAHLYPQSFALKDIRKMEVKADGGFANVYRGLHYPRNQFVAVKVAKDEKSDARHLKELAMWAYLSHPNILSFYGVFQHSQRSAICLVSPWMDNGNMHDYCMNHCPSEEERLLLLGDVIEGLLYLHERNIVHGDIKGKNVLISSTRRGLIADFGISRIMNPVARLQDVNDSAMSNRWAAPERFRIEKLMKASDVWSFGCLVYEIMSRRIPYYTCEYDYLVQSHVSEGKLPIRPKGSEESDEILEDSFAWGLITSCLLFNHAERPTCQKVLEKFAGSSNPGEMPKRYSKGTISTTGSFMNKKPMKSGVEFDFSRIYVLLFSTPWRNALN